jgi:hypothetical protein
MRSSWLRGVETVGALLFVSACGSSSSGIVDGGSQPDSGAATDAAGRGDVGARGDTGAQRGPDAGGGIDAARIDGGSDSGQPTTDGGNPPADTGTADAPASASGLHVVGNHLVDNGKTVRLLGIDRSGSEYSCTNNAGFFDGPVDQTAVTAMLSWHVNAVRVPLNEDCWLGINGAPAQYSGSAYQSAIAQFVTLLRGNGLYVIVDLHWNAGGTNLSNSQEEMADSDHGPAFWASVAGAFKSDQGVLFDLYNEPHDVAWSCWLNGGCQTNGWTVAGMNQLITAVRTAGATNVVMAGGLAYSSDLSQWLANKPTDPMGNLAASFHTYNFTGCADSTCWSSQIQSVAASVPVITGELGENDCAQGYIDGYMSWADSAGVSYLGWAWNTDSCGGFPSLISDYSGTPTAFGAGLQAHLAVENP